MGEENKFAIKKHDKAGKSIWGIAFIIICAIIFVVCVFMRLTKKEEEAAMPLAAVDTIKMGTGDIYLQESIMGTILPTDTYYVINKVSGEITKTYVKNGDYVKKGDPICEIDNQKQIDAAFIKYDTVKNTYERMVKLYESGDISKQNFESVKAEYDGAKLAYDTQVEFATPVATGDGYIENTDMTLGVTKNTGSVLCYITSDGGMDVQFSVTERVLKGIRIGDNVTIEKQSKTYNATIYDKASLISQATGLFNIKAKIEDENDFASGVMAKVTLYFDESLNTNILPKEVIYYDNEKPYVYILKDDNKVTIKNVTLGIETDKEVEVLSGLQKNDKVIATWSSELAEGAEVNEVSSNIYKVIEKKARVIKENQIVNTIDSIEETLILATPSEIQNIASVSETENIATVAETKNINMPIEIENITSSASNVDNFANEEIAEENIIISTINETIENNKNKETATASEPVLMKPLDTSTINIR